MGVDKFYTYAGRVDTLNCTIWKYIYNNINKDQLYQIVSGTNAQYNEVWWFYPSAGSLVNDSYAIYNYSERIWYYGSLNRTAWLDSALRQYPMAAFSVQVTYLAAVVTASDTSIQLIDSGTYPTTGSIQIDSEVISYTGNSNNVLTGCRTTKRTDVARLRLTHRGLHRRQSDQDHREKPGEDTHVHLKSAALSIALKKGRHSCC